MTKKFCVAVSRYHKFKLSRVTVHELKLRIRKQMSEQSSVSMHHVYYMGTDNADILRWICDV
jgi:hypothetical protein